MANACNFLDIVVDPKDANIDIVTVHSLNPANVESHAYMTWTSKDSKTLRLRDFLPQRIPHARVMIFGYNSSVACDTSIDGVEEQASNLLDRLHTQRKTTPNRPIIFVCHSLGGIVVKEALVQTKLNSVFGDIGYATYGIAFFGTPHRGGNMTGIGGVVSNVARAVVQGPKNNFMEALKESPFSASFVKKFRYLVDQYHILSFYETRPFKKLGHLVVDRESATLGQPGNRERQIGLDADHSSVCKFSSIDDAAYKQVIDNLEQLNEGALSAKATEDQIAVDAKLTKTDMQACLQSFWFREMDSRVNDVKDAAESTCTWLDTHTLYQDWQKSQRSILWVRGNPGTGKSTLMKYALLKKSTRTKIIGSFFFNRRGFELEKTLPGCYRSLIHQLLPYHGDELMRIAKIYQDRCDNRGPYELKWQWHKTELKNYMCDIIRSIAKLGALCIYIDALDEAGEANAIELIERLQNLAREAAEYDGSLQILFACRHYPIITLGGPMIDVRDESRSDIATYVRQRFTDQAIDPVKMEELIPEILARANGVFQWITLVLPRVFFEIRRGKRLVMVQRAIRQLPMELEQLHKTLLAEVPQEERPELLRLFSWICFAVEPLSIPEIRHAVLVDPRKPSRTLQNYKDDSDFAETDKEMESRIIDLSKGLLEIRGFTDQPGGEWNYQAPEAQSIQPSWLLRLRPAVADGFRVALGDGKLRVPQIVHESVSDFLVNQNGFEVLLNNGLTFGELEANTLLASSCVQYMLLDDVKAMADEVVHGYEKSYQLLFTAFPFLLHAVMRWLDYVVKSHQLDINTGRQRSETDLVGIFTTLDPMFDRAIFFYQQFSDHQLFETGMTVIHVASLFNMPRVLRQLLSSDMTYLNTQDKVGCTPLCYAAGVGSLEVAKVLLEYDENKIGVNIRDQEGVYPLSLAMEWGHEERITLLLSVPGIDPDKKQFTGRTPLGIATQKGLEGPVKQLLEHGGVDVNVTSEGKCPLENATLSGSTSIVKLLLNHGGVDINASKSTSCPLSIAADRGFEEIVELLLNCEGIKIDRTDYRKMTPLMCAAAAGQVRIVEMLLNYGVADVNHRSNWGNWYYEGSALEIALRNGCSEIVRLLLTCENLEVGGIVLPSFMAFKLVFKIRGVDLDVHVLDELRHSETWKSVKWMARKPQMKLGRVHELYEKLSIS